jgi:PhoPQ-activated pathogenicity-related protein
LQIFENLKEEFFDNAYVQLMIDRKNINKAEYIERIKDIKKQYGESFNISIKVYDADLIQEQLDITPIQTNIDEYIDNNVPLHLELKYKTIKEKLRADNSSDF